MAGRIDLAAVEASLRDLQAGFPWLNEGLESPRDRLDDEVILNLLAGYAYIDRAVAAGIDFLALGNLKHLLELNTIVLCGEEPSARRLNARHIAATERHFWDESRGGVRDIVEWHDRHRNETVWQRAAGVYIRILSEPQLYIEGNHRTGARHELPARAQWQASVRADGGDRARILRSVDADHQDAKVEPGNAASHAESEEVLRRVPEASRRREAPPQRSRQPQRGGGRRGARGVGLIGGDYLSSAVSTSERLRLLATTERLASRTS